MFVYPKEITVLGKKMTFVGFGKYPYDCIAKSQHPQAAIYAAADGAWTTEHSHFCKVAIKECLSNT